MVGSVLAQRNVASLENVPDQVKLLLEGPGSSHKAGSLSLNSGEVSRDRQG